MDAGTDRKVVLVTRKTRLDELVARYHSVAQARFYIEHLGADFADYQREHATYLQARGGALAAIARFRRRQVIDRQFLPNFLFGPDDIVVALGQDGLVANTMKYLEGQPLVGVNPDPARHDGILLPFRTDDLPAVLAAVARDRRTAKAVTMAKATLSDRQVLYAVNDLFVGPKSHTSARYEIRVGETSEVQSSSGIIVSTGLGSTAWMKSIVTGALAIAGGSGGRDTAYRPLPWDADRLLFAVREPFPSVSSRTDIVFGAIGQGNELRLRSLMPENGVIFSDGIETDFLEFNSGTEARIGIAERRGQLVQ
jgi:NAD kinase